MALGFIASPINHFLRFMRLFILGFLIGCNAIFLMTSPWSWGVCLTFFLCSFVLLLFSLSPITFLIIGGCAGVFLVSFFIHLRVSEALPPSLENKTIWVTGRIVELPENLGDHSRFLFKIQSAPLKNHLVQLSVYATPMPLAAGQLWRLAIRLKRPHGFANPGSFDTEAYLFEQGIMATGYVASGKPSMILIGNSFSIWNVIHHLRQSILTQIQTMIGKYPLWELIPALIMGSRQYVTASDWQTLQATGTNHLIAIAGLHVGLIAMIIFFMINRLWRYIPRACLYVPAQIAGACGSVIGAFLYSLLAGFPIQTERAMIMLFVFLSATIFRKRWLNWTSFYLALGIILLFNPLHVLSMSFWMSFGTVFIILYATIGRSIISSKWMRLCKIQWAITIGILPFLLLFIGQVSLISPIANLIAVPWFGLVILPLCLAVLFFIGFWPSLTKILLIILLKNLQYLWAILSYFQTWPFLTWHSPHLAFWRLFFLMIAILLFLAPRGWFARYLSLFFVLPIFFYPATSPPEGHYQLTVLDVDEGLSMVVRTAHHVLIYDTGPKWSPDFDAGKAIVLPYLYYEGISRINMMMVSHGDSDHSGGAASILKAMPVEQLLSSIPSLFPDAKNKGYCMRGQKWVWDGVTFTVLSPDPNMPYEDNNSSCVLKVDNGLYSVLLTGDIEKTKELDLVHRFSHQLSSTILVAPHHGSASSSSMAFLKRVKPKYLLFSSGYLNRFHFPNESVIHRAEKLNILMINTAITGSITFEVGQSLSQPLTYRQAHSFVWSWKV